jgi:hypothetical protein
MVKNAPKLFLRECRATFHFTQVTVKSFEVVPSGTQRYDLFHLGDSIKTPKTFLREYRARISFEMCEQKGRCFSPSA